MKKLLLSLFLVTSITLGSHHFFFGLIKLLNFETHSVIFNGTDETISFGDILDKTNTTEFSIAIWANPDNVTGSGKLVVAKDGPALFRGYNIQQTGADLTAFLINGGSDFIGVSVTSVYASTTWVHIVLTKDTTSDAAGVSIYKDGVSQSVTITQDLLTGTLANADPLRLGARGTTATFFFPGKLTSFVMVDKELSAAEVTELYNMGMTVDVTTLSFAGNVDLYAPLGEDFDDLESGSGVLDQSGNGNDGTAANMTNAANKSTDLP